MSFGRRTVFLLCLCSSLSSAAISLADDSDPDLTALQTRAIRLYQDGRIDEALPLYKRLAQRRPHDVVILKNLMWILWKTGDTAGTAAVAARVTELLPEDIEAWNLLGQASDANGQWKEAIHAYRRELALEPQNDAVRVALGRLYLNIKDDDAAIAIFDQVIKRKPNSVDAFAALAQIYFYKGSYDLSLENWRKALMIKPKEASYQFGEAKALYYSGQPDQAIAQMKHVLASSPNNREITDFLTDDAMAHGDLASARELLTGRLTEFRQEDEMRIFQLAAVLESRGEWEEAIAVLKRYLNVNATNGQALLAMGDALNYVHRPTEAVTYYERVLTKNATSIRALVGLGDSYINLSQPKKAQDAFRLACQTDPTNPTLLLRYAQILHDSQDYAASRKILTDWVNQQNKIVLPVLLYHGLTPLARDPLLAYTVHMSTGAFEDQMKAIHDAGYTPVTAEQVNNWLQHNISLPKKPILITFDDAREDSFRYADPILEKYGLRATMFTPTHDVDENLAGNASWDELKNYAHTSRWEIQAHGDLAHGHIQIDADGRQGIFLAQKMWLPKENRLESFEEWRARIDADHLRSIQKIQDHTGASPVALAWPEGNFGQDSVPNSPEAAALNIEMARRHFGLAFQEDEFGLNLRSRDPMLVSRLQPTRMSGKALIHYLQSNNPIARAHRIMMQQAVWENRTADAEKWFAALKSDEVDDSVLLIEEARLQKAGGQDEKAIALAKQAILLEDSADNRRFLADMLSEKQGGWTAGTLYQKDNQQRQSLAFEQSLDVGKTGPLHWSLLQHFGRYLEEGAPSVNDLGGGASVRWPLQGHQQLQLRADGHAFSQQVTDEYSAQGEWDAQWSQGWSSHVEGARTPYDSARAIDAGVIDRFARGTVEWQDPGIWHAGFTGAGHNLSDGNHRYTGSLELGRNLSWKPLQVIVLSSFDRMNDISLNYYSPQDLQLNQAGLEFSQTWHEGETLRLRYLPGAGKEDGTSWEFAQEISAGFTIPVGRLNIQPSYVYYMTPTYRLHSYFLGLAFPF